MVMTGGWFMALFYPHSYPLQYYCMNPLSPTIVPHIFKDISSVRLKSGRPATFGSVATKAQQSWTLLPWQGCPWRTLVWRNEWMRYEKGLTRLAQISRARRSCKQSLGPGSWVFPIWILIPVTVPGSVAIEYHGWYHNPWCFGTRASHTILRSYHFAKIP